MKIMVANSERKHKSETMLEVIRGLVLDFVFILLLHDKVPFIYNFSTKIGATLSSHLFKKEDGGWEVCPTTLLKLPQNWVICIEKGGSNNFA